jgi:NADH dehydrogenase
MILVVGATGYLGGMIARRLLEDGRPVRILVRPTSAYQDLVSSGAAPLTGDLKDPASLSAACQGVETVITTANSAQRGGDDTVESVDRQGNRNLIDAAKAAGVSQFIFTSALGADVHSPIPFMQAKGASEVYLRDSGVPFTILAPNIYMDVWVPMIVGAAVQSGQPVTIVGEGRRRHTFVATADVAAFAVAAVGHPAATNQYLAIGGPEALSWRDVIATVERVLGRTIAVQSVAPGEAVPGIPPPVAPLMAAFETYDSPLDMADAARTFGVRLTTLEEFVRQAFGGAAP